METVESEWENWDNSIINEKKVLYMNQILVVMHYKWTRGCSPGNGPCILCSSGMKWQDRESDVAGKKGICEERRAGKPWRRYLCRLMETTFLLPGSCAFAVPGSSIFLWLIDQTKAKAVQVVYLQKLCWPKPLLFTLFKNIFGHRASSVTFLHSLELYIIHVYFKGNLQL